MLKSQQGDIKCRNDKMRGWLNVRLDLKLSEWNVVRIFRSFGMGKCQTQFSYGNFLNFFTGKYLIL